MYQQFDTTPPLNKFISFFYEMKYSNDNPPLQALLPSCTAIMGWQYKGNWRISYNINNKVHNYILPHYYITGQQTVCYNLTAEDGETAIMGAAFQPGTLALLLNTPAYHFTNKIVPAVTLFPKNVIEPAIAAFNDASNTKQRLNVLKTFYTGITKGIKTSDSIFHTAVNMIFKQKGCISVSEVCDSLNINQRYLQREFRQKIGVPPSTYISILRFNNIFTEICLSPEKQNLQNLAMYYNYYDLSHFSKDFRKYFNLPPASFILEKFQLLKALVKKKPYLIQVQHNHVF